jgi:hypothetical protein
VQRTPVGSLSRSCGERVRVRGTTSRVNSAPHPNPLPVKDGEREQTEIVARLIPFRRNGLV